MEMITITYLVIKLTIPSDNEYNLLLKCLESGDVKLLDDFFE